MLKKLRTSSKKIGDMELYRKIVELEGEIIELTRANNDLEKLADELKKSLENKALFTFQEPFYFAEGDDVPYCAKCFEGGKKETFHLKHYYTDKWGSKVYDCPNCKTNFHEK